MENVTREQESIEKNQIEILELKNIVTIDGFNLIRDS